jgi:hypothetical protein
MKLAIIERYLERVLNKQNAKRKGVKNPADSVKLTQLKKMKN